MGFFRNNILLRKKAFSPNSIPNLGFWLESDYGITKDGSNAVSEWVDRSPNGYTLSQATGANQPIFTANEFGPHAGLIFDGTNDSLERSVSNPFSNSQTFTCFIVLKAQNNNSTQCLWGMGDLGSTQFYAFYKGSNLENNSIVTHNLTPTNNFVYGNTAINNNIGRLVIIESDGADWFERINRTNQTLTVGAGTNTGDAPGDFSTLDNITLAILRRSTTAFYRSNFAAILFYNTQISAADRTRVEDYLINKYAI